MATPPSDSFCVLPWMHVFADELGTIYPCCRSVDTQLPNCDDSGKPIRIQDENGLERAWNSQYMRSLRLGMLAGEFPSPCDRCYVLEEAGVGSYRQEVNRRENGRLQAWVDVTGEDGSLPLDLRSFDLRLGNLCNLRCRMCSPQSSKALIQEWADFHGVKPTHPAFDTYRTLDWFESPQFWKTFETHSRHIERLHFAGGEPLLVEGMFHFLERLIGLGRASAITLSYNTNLTLIPPRVYELWPHFAGVRLTVSVDGYGAVNSYIRYPAKWETIDANLHRVDRDAAALNCRPAIGINTTVQLLNILQLDELLQYLATGFEHLEPPNLSPLRFPDYYSVRTLPRDLKMRAAEKLRACLASSQDRWPAHWAGAPLQKLTTSVEGCINYMLEADQEEALPLFRKWTLHHDQHRGQQLSRILPELASLMP